MFEAKLEQASLIKKIVEAIKELINDAPFDLSENAFCLQVCSSFLCRRGARIFWNFLLCCLPTLMIMVWLQLQ